jgi:organic radical activating enzyme
MTTYYCNQKFNWVQISMFDGRVQSCCQAQEDSPTLEEIKSHPVGFFNYPQIIKDRTSMLEGQKISGCQSCWAAEKKGLVSRRLRSDNSERLTDVDNAKPQSLSIVISNTCAMTCVYCCKKFSHSWRADLVNNGNYLSQPDQRFIATARDKVLYKLSQVELESTEFYRTVLDQIDNTLDTVTELDILGGEPFLSANLFELLDKVNNDSTQIKIYTGLGVSTSRLKKVIERLTPFKNLIVQISGENIGAAYEFVRYGNSFSNFENNINLINKSNLKIEYSCSLSNISVFNFLDFVDRYGDSTTQNLHINTVHEPDFLSLSVLDDESKHNFLNNLDRYDEYFDTSILRKAISVSCSDQDRINSRDFLVEFAKRRNLSLEIFPKSFVKWLLK